MGAWVRGAVGLGGGGQVGSIQRGEACVKIQKKRGGGFGFGGVRVGVNREVKLL